MRTSKGATIGPRWDTLTVDVTGQAHLLVIAKVIDGDASLDVSVTALVPGQPEVVVIHQTVVTTQTTTATPAATTTTASPTPTPTTNAANNTTATPTNATTP